MTTPVPILLYHSISTDITPRYRPWAVHPDTFAAHMAYLRDGGFTPITVSRLAQAMIGPEARLPDRPVVVTIDDGLADFYTGALPILSCHGITATLYITTGFVGETSRWMRSLDQGARPMLTWSQIAEIQACGIECGAHSRSHLELDVLSPGAAREEIFRSRHDLEQRLARPIMTFAYPHGYHSAAVRRFVEEAGYSSACAVKHAMSATTDDRFALARIIVTDADHGHIDAFRGLLQGQGLRVAPVGERARTKGWRAARRAAAIFKRHFYPAMSNTQATRTHVGTTAAIDGTRQAGAGRPDLVPAQMPGPETGQAPLAVRAEAPVGEDRPAHTLPRTAPRPEPLLVTNLLNNLADLGALLSSELRRGSWLNAYLLAAGMNQIVEDYLHPDLFFLGKAAERLAALPRPLGRPAAGTARALYITMAHIRRRRAAIRRLCGHQSDLAALAQRLADIALCPDAPTAAAREGVRASCDAIQTTLAGSPPRLLRQVMRIPSCFRSFDQQPADLERIVREFAQRWPDRATPLVVAGIRTSGSYLAPLYAAFLKAQGYRDVKVLTVRPGRPLLPAERALLRDVIRRDGLALLADDPPVSGGSLAGAARDLERAGCPSRSIVLLLQLFESRDAPAPVLNEYAAIRLPWEEWAVHEQLTPRAVQAALTDLLGHTASVDDVERQPLPPRATPRGHVRALYQVRLADRDAGRRREQMVLVAGAGLGYFGEHALAVARALPQFVPAVYGFRAGLLYRAWLPEERKVSALLSGKEDDLAAALAGYVLARHRALSVSKDVSSGLIDRLPVWEAASNLLSQVFGAAWLLVRVPIVDPAAKRLLQCGHPSIVDGSMTLSHCFVDEVDDKRIRKVDFDERAFSNRNLSCYDPVFDLASLAASVDLAGSSTNGPAGAPDERLRAAYESRSSEPVGEERWLLYQLVHLWDRQRAHEGERPAIRRAMARAVQRYFAAVYFSSAPAHPTGALTVCESLQLAGVGTRGATAVAVPSGTRLRVTTSVAGPRLFTDPTGALCALDIDGVLETSPLGFPCLTPAGAMTIRALTLHGYRIVLATGRGLDEVRERCDAYHLAGGVAEYGAVVYNRSTGRARSLLSETDRAHLGHLRATLEQIAGVHLDPDYQHAVRAYHLSAAGHRRGLAPGTLAALAAAGVGRHIRPIIGEGQTDFMVAGIDKSSGLRVLIDELDSGACRVSARPLAMAVGDTIADLPMFGLAARAYAPASADEHVRNTGVTVLKRPYQAGLALAAAQLLGHPPGGCSICRGPRLSPEARLLLTVLAAQENGKRGMARSALLLAARTWSMTVTGQLKREVAPCAPNPSM